MVSHCIPPQSCHPFHILSRQDCDSIICGRSEAKARSQVSLPLLPHLPVLTSTLLSPRYHLFSNSTAYASLFSQVLSQCPSSGSHFSYTAPPSTGSYFSVLPHCSSISRFSLFHLPVLFHCSLTHRFSLLLHCSHLPVITIIQPPSPGYHFSSTASTSRF